MGFPLHTMFIIFTVNDGCLVKIKAILTGFLRGFVSVIW